MVKIKSQSFSAVTGSMGGVSAGSNRSGSYLRARRTPTVSRTSRSAESKAVFTSLNQGWNSLTAAQREGWDRYGREVKVSGSLGEARNRTGQQWFISTNQARLVAGIPIELNAPTTANTGNPVDQIFSAVLVGATLTVRSRVRLLASGAGRIILSLAPALNAGRTAVKGRYRIGGFSSIAAGGLQSDTVVDTDVLGYGYQIGSRVPLRSQLVYLDARQSLPYETVHVIT